MREMTAGELDRWYRRRRWPCCGNPAELYRPGPRIGCMQIMRCVGCGMKINVIDPEADRGVGDALVGQVLEVPRGYEPPRVALWWRIVELLRKDRA